MTTLLLAFVYWTLREYTHVAMFQYDLMTKLGQVIIPFLWNKTYPKIGDAN